MTIPFKISIEHIIIAILVFLLFFNGCNGESTVVATSEKETIEKTVVTVDSASNNQIKNQVPEKVNVIETPQKVVTVDDVNELSEQDRKKVKQVNRYLDTTYLEGAVIFSDILAEGRILKKDIIAEIEHKETVTSITNTIIKQPGGLFISPGINYSPIFGIEAVETSLTVIKGNWGISAGGYYSFRNYSPGIKIKIHKKLF